MNCLTELIGLDECGTRVAGKLYINDMPGWNSSLLGYLTTDEKPNTADVFNAAALRAAMRLEDDWRQAITSKISAPSIIGRGNIGMYQDGKRIRPASAGKHAGIRVTANGSAFTQLNIDQIKVFWPVAVSSSIIVVDLLQGAILATYPFTSVAGGYATIEANLAVRSMGQAMDIAILAPANNGSYDGAITYGGCRECGTKWEAAGKNVYAQTTAFTTGGPYTDATATSLGHINGVSATYALSCDYEAVLCQYAHRLKRAMVYAALVEVLNEALFSKRLNSFTSVNREDVVEQRDMYAELYNEAVGSVFTNLVLPNDICFACRPAVRAATYIP
jgi:hypothetical protein